MTLIDSLRLTTADRTELADLGPEWERLRTAAGVTSPFMSWPWVGAWLETLGADADLEVVLARTADGRLVGVAPFQIARTVRAGIRLRELAILGSGPAAPDHLDLLVHPEAPPTLAEGLWSETIRRRRWDLVNLDGITANGSLAAVAAGDDASPLRAPYLPLAGTWTDVAAGFSGRLRSNLKRYGRKLDAENTVTERLITDATGVDETFDHLVRFHQAIRTNKGDPGVFADPEVEAFLRLATHRFREAGRLRLWRLDADGAPIATILCFRSETAVAFYTTGYDTEWSRYGPGRRIMARAIQGALEEGAAEFDFLRGDEPYKQEWGTTVRTDLVVRRPSSLLGRGLWAGRAAARFTRQALRRTA